MPPSTYKKPVQLQRRDNAYKKPVQLERGPHGKKSATGAIAGTIILYFLLFMCAGTAGVLIYKMSN